MTSFKVDLTKIKGPVYTGRGRGEALREQFDLAHKEEESDLIEVIIPNDTYTVSSSFFLGLFGPSVIKYGSVRDFQQKYHFQAPSFLEKVLEDHAAKALQEKQLFT